MEEELTEFTIFTVTDKDGKEVEMAVLDEFEVDHKNYVAAGRVEGDTVSDEGVYLYRVKVTEDDFIAEKITDPDEYKAVSEAYMELE